MSIQPPQGILNIPNATLRVGKLAVDSTAGFDTVFNNVERNTILLEDSTEYTETKQWDLKMPNIFVATFEIKGDGSSFNFRNTSNGDATKGYTLTFSGTTLTLKYDNASLTTATIPDLDATYGKVYLTYEKQHFTVTVDGTLVLTYKDTGTRTFPDGEYVNFFAGTGSPGFKNLKVVAGHFISDGTSNVSLFGGLAVTSNLEVGSSNLFVDTVNSRVGVGTDTPKESLDVVGNMHLTRVSNVSQIKVDSNVVTEYTGPHDRPLRKYPEIILPRAAVGAEYNGYRIDRSSEHVTAPYDGVHDLFNETAVDYTDTWGAGWQGTSGAYSTSTGEHTAYVTGGTTQGTAARLASNVPNGEWVSLQVSTPIKLDNVEIRSRNVSSGGETQFPKDFEFWGSDDGTTWYHIKSFTGVTSSGISVLHKYNVNSTTLYNRFALVVTKIPGETSSGANDGAAHFSISELRFNGHEEGSGSLDTTLKSVYNVPATTGTQLEVYYDGRETSSYSGSGTTVTDISPNTNNGTLNGGVGFDSTYKAFTFDGTTTRNITTTLPSSVTGEYVHSVSLWVKADEVSRSGGVFTFFTIGSASSTNMIALGVNTAGDGIKYDFFNADVRVESPQITSNEWMHFVVTYSGGANNLAGAKRIYLNGKELSVSYGGSSFSSPLSLPTSPTLTLGGQINSSNPPISGSIANFRLYSKVLNADQVKELYDYQKDYFLGSKSQVTLYKGHLGVGVTEPSGQLELAGDERIQEYPPRGMTGFDTYIEGHGVFTASASSVFSSAEVRQAYQAFNGGIDLSNDDAWISKNDRYTSGLPNANAALINGVAGEWLGIQFPYPIKLKQIAIQNRGGGYNDRSPDSGILWGSNDGTEYEQVVSWSGLSFVASGSTPSYVTINATNTYRFFRLQGTKVVNTNTSDFLAIGELKFFGTPGPTTLDKGSLSLTRSLDVPRISRYDVDTETPRPEKLVVDFDTTVNSSPTDISGQGNHGTYHDASGAPAYSVADKAFDFDGVNGVIYSGALSPAMTGDRICSMSCWFKTNDAANNNTQTLMWLGAYQGQGFIGLLIQNNQLKLTIGSDRAIETTSSPIQSNQWYHVVAIKSGTGQINSSTANSILQIYINGEKSTDTTFQNQTGTLNITTNYLYLGSGNTTGAEPLSGYISNPKLYDTVLEPSEVQKLYRLGRTGRSMVISDTAVGIGKVPEAQLDVRGSARFGSIPRFHGSYSGTFDFSGDGYLPGFRMDDGCIGLHMRCILNPYGDSNGVIKIAGSRDQLGNDNTVGEYGAFTQLKGAAISVQSDLELAPDTEDAVEPILWTMDIAATGKENSFIGTTANSRYHFNYRSTGCDRGDGTRTVYGHGWFRHQSNYLSEIKLNASVGSVRGQYQIIKYY